MRNNYAQILLLVTFLAVLLLAEAHRNREGRGVFRFRENILLDKHCYDDGAQRGRVPLWEVSAPIDAVTDYNQTVRIVELPELWTESVQDLQELSYSYPFSVHDASNSNHMTYCCTFTLDHKCCPKNPASEVPEFLTDSSQSGTSCLEFVQAYGSVGVKTFQEDGSEVGLTLDTVHLGTAYSHAVEQQADGIPSPERQNGLIGADSDHNRQTHTFCSESTLNAHHHHYAFDVLLEVSGSSFWTQNIFGERYLINQDLEIDFHCGGSVSNAVGTMISDAQLPESDYQAIIIEN